jgi:predicted DCC family thiol-disulfide oxidoreductase YuxK
MSQSEPSLTVYYDGACPLCRAEMGHYRAQEGAGAICFLDASTQTSDLPHGLTREHALARFHVRLSDGRIASGAQAFVEIWKTLPRWRWAAWLAGLPGVPTLLEVGYRLFLPIRPYLSKALGKLKS